MNLYQPHRMRIDEITDETPITIPRTVSADLTFDDRSMSSAAIRFSRACDGCMNAIYSALSATIGSSRDARIAG